MLKSDVGMTQLEVATLIFPEQTLGGQTDES